MRLKMEVPDFIVGVMKIMQEKFWIKKYFYCCQSCFKNHLRILFINYQERYEDERCLGE